MRQIFTLLLVMIFTFSLKAERLPAQKALVYNVQQTQETPVSFYLNESFEGSEFPALNWSLYPLKSDPVGFIGTWEIDTLINHTPGGSCSAVIRAHDYENEERMITSQMRVTATDTIFSFWINDYYVEGNFGNKVELYVDIFSSKGRNVGTINYVEGLPLNTWKQIKIDLKDYIGKVVSIQFRGVAGWGSYNLALDDIQGPPLAADEHNLGIMAVYPKYALKGCSYNPKVELANYGLSDESTYDVELTDGALYHETISNVNIKSQKKIELTFPSWMPHDSINTLKATLHLAGDTSVSNNSYIQTFKTYNYAYNNQVYSVEFLNWTTQTYNTIRMTNGRETAVDTITSVSMPAAEVYDGFGIFRLYHDGSLSLVSPTGKQTYLGTISGLRGEFNSMAYNFKTKKMYVIVNNTRSISHQLCVLNMNTFKLTRVGAQSAQTIIGASFADDGLLYGPSTDDDKLYKIDPTTGVTTAIGDVGFDLNTEQDVTFDRTDHRLYSYTVPKNPSGGWDWAGYNYGYYDLTTGKFIVLITSDWVGVYHRPTIVSTRFETSLANDVKSFSIPQQVGASIIDSANHTISIQMPFNVSRSALTPSIVISDTTSISPASGVMQDFTKPIVYSIKIQNDLYQLWTVTVTNLKSKENDIQTFTIPNQTEPSIIDTSNHTVTVLMPYGTNRTALIPSLTISDSAKIYPASGVQKNFTYPVSYTVFAQNGTYQTWKVTVKNFPGSSANDILTFSIPSQVGSTIIDTTNHTVIVQMPFGTNRTALVPLLTISDSARISPASGVVKDFTYSVYYNVFAQSGKVQTWKVMVRVLPGSSANKIVAFAIPSQIGSSIIDTTKHTVVVQMPFGTNRSALVPSITVSDSARISPASGVEKDFTYSVYYTVFAQSGKSQTWIVTVRVVPSSSANKIIAFTIPSQTGSSIIDTTNHTVVVQMPFGTNRSALVPSITVSDSARISPALGVEKDFTYPVSYTVFAQNGKSQIWTVTVNVLPDPSAKEILTFAIPSQVGESVIDNVNHTVTVTLPFGTNLTALVPVFTVSNLASISSASGIAQDFSSPVVYTVTAQDASKQTWTVSVNMQAAPTYAINYSVVNANGILSATVKAKVITSSEQISEGSNVEFTATPDANYKVKEWRLNNVTVDGNSSNSLTLMNLKSNVNVTVEFEMTTSINIFENNRLLVYPNPTKGLLYVLADRDDEITVFDVSGRVVAIENNKPEVIDITAQKAGLYMVQLKNKKGTTYYKVIKE